MEDLWKKTWKVTQYLLFDRNVKPGGEELWTFIILNSCFSTCLERIKLEDQLRRTVAEWKILCMTCYVEGYGSLWLLMDLKWRFTLCPEA